MQENSPTGHNDISPVLPAPVLLTPTQAQRVAGGGSNVRHGNPGGGPAPYNNPSDPAYNTQYATSFSLGEGPSDHTP